MVTKSLLVELQSLYKLLSVLNTADSDKPAESWLMPSDSKQSKTFGYIASAVIELGGHAMYNHWCDTNEVDLTLATRITISG